TVVIDPPLGKPRPVPIAGLVHDRNVPSPVFSNRAFGYITMDTLEWLGEPRAYNELHLVVDGDGLDKAHIAQVVEEVRRKVEKSGRTVHYTWIPEPGRHWAQDVLDAMTFLLLALGGLSLLLSGFLVINTLTAVLAQQVRQIGVMKAVGAGRGQLAGMYLGMAAAYGLMSLLVAVPLGAAGARVLTRFGAGLINVDVPGFRLPPVVLALQAAVGLGVPLLAALYPVLAGTRVTVREAISDYGVGPAAGHGGLLDRWLRRVPALPRPVLLSLRNTFRRKGRLVLTLATLSLGGAIFIAVLSVHASLQRTLDDALKYWHYDVAVNFSRSYRVKQIEQVVRGVPGVLRAETWGFEGVRRLRPDGTEGESTVMIAPPPGSRLLQPTLTAGRWLLPGDENAVVVNTEFLKDEPDVDVGEDVVLKLDSRETTWRVVGVVRGVLTGPSVYANAPHFARVARDVGRARSVRVVTERHDAEFQAQVARVLERRFEAAGMQVAQVETIAQVRRNVEQQFNIIVAFLLAMAALLAVVGALGLAGTMSINVLERLREIGVMRAIGASGGAIRQVFIVEGVFIGILSWLIGGILSLPISKLLSDTVGNLFVQESLSFRFSTPGALLWLLIVVVLAAVASFFPAWNASRLSVRDVLAYE
ncbi:MAG TPA: ABC transporter permease, partial [Thermaerobacter sp.]